MMKIVRILIAAILFSGPAVAEDVQLTDEQMQDYVREMNFSRCEDSPGGTAVIPLNQLQGIVQPAAGSAPRGGAAEGRGTR